MRITNTLLLILMSIFMFACSEETDKVSGSGDHVWKEQTDTIEKAKEVEGIILDSAKQTREAVE
ncbi:MAG: hypothetical protein MI865_12090 [Proteobacteria bacterium]|nr:hypothetical protein [Pseudomonadota bacterium]